MSNQLGNLHAPLLPCLPNNQPLHHQASPLHVQVFNHLTNRLKDQVVNQVQGQLRSLVRNQPLNLVASRRANHQQSQVLNHLCSLLFNQRVYQARNLL